MLAATAAIATDAGQARGQETIDVVSDAPRNEFPRGVTFTLSFQAEGDVDEVRLHYELEPDGAGATAVAECQEAATINCSYTLTSGRGINVIPGAVFTYRWSVEFADGTDASTEEQRYEHEDTRFTFAEISEGNVTVRYHSGSAGTAQEVLRAAVETLAEVGRLEQTQVTFPVKVYLYATAEEMQPAIVAGGGQGVTVLGEVVYSDTAMVSADVSTIDITRHEIAHIVTREATRGPFPFPGWLNEGISVYAQIRPLSGHNAALNDAIARDDVLTMAELSSSSTGGSSSTVSLYYGQSGSIVSYLVRTYGEEQFAELLRTFRQGSRPDAAFETVYGFDLRGLENEWREWVGLPARQAPVATATAAEGQAAVDDTPAAGADDEDDAVSSRGDGEGRDVTSWALIGGLVAAVIATGAYSLTVVRSRL